MFFVLRIMRFDDRLTNAFERISPIVIKHLRNGMKLSRVTFFARRISVGQSRSLQSIDFVCYLGELLIDVEDKLIRRKYVSSLDIEIVSDGKMKMCG